MPNPLIGFATGVVNYGLNQDSMSQQYDYTRRLAAQQNQANILMWERNNAYNSPLQQMARLKAAGLNPQLAYGNQPQSDAPQLVGGTTPTPQVTPISATDIANSSLLAAQEENIRADTALKLRDVDLKGTEIDLNSANVKLLGAQFNWTNTQIAKASKEMDAIDQSIAESNQRIAEMTEHVNLMKSQRDLTDYQAASAYVDSLYAHYRNNAEFREAVSRCNLNNATIKQILTLLPLEASEIEQHIKNMKKEHVLLVQAIKKGKISANVASKYSDFLEFMYLWKQMQGIVASLPMPKVK